MQIYLDYSATTPPRPEAIARMQQVMAESWGNPSSLHAWGERAALVLETARMQVAELVNAPPEAIVFTAGGTESDNLAILGVARHYARPRHIVISQVEHSAVAEPVRLLEERGWQVTRLPVNAQGRVDPDDLVAALRPDTVLVSIIYGQSEVGTLQPIEQLVSLTHTHSSALFHTDAVQAAGRVPLDVQRLPVDLLSLSSHKIYGPQGAGALYVRPGVDLIPLLAGGGQEWGVRSGTQAVPLMAGFGIAAQLAAQELATEAPRLRQMRDRLFDLLADVPNLQVTGDRLHRLPHHASFAIQPTTETLNGRTLVRQMHLAGIGISAGSACNSGKSVPSPTLRAMGLSDNAAQGGIRLTLGHHTTAADIEWTALVLKQLLNRLATPQSPCPSVS